MPAMTLRDAALAVVLAGVAGCAARPLPPPPPPPPPVDYEKIHQEEAVRYKKSLVMGEVGRTHPVLTATLDRDMYRLRGELAKAPARVNEVRRDLHLGPPLREACRLRWTEGISELLARGAKCLGYSDCEACVRSHAAGPAHGIAPAAPARVPAGVGQPPGQRPPTRVQPAP